MILKLWDLQTARAILRTMTSRVLLSIGTALDWNEVRWVDIVQSEPLPQIFITLV